MLRGIDFGSLGLFSTDVPSNIISLQGPKMKQ